MSIGLIILFLSTLIQGYYGQLNYSVVTIPAKVPGQDKVIIPVTIGQENITVSCFIYIQSGGVQNEVAYQWKLFNISTEMITNVTFTNVISNEFPFLVSGMPNVSNPNNITVTQFTAQMNRMELVCAEASNTISESFLFGIPETPTLTVSNIITNQTEGANFTVNLESASNNPFSPYVSSVWTYNGQSIQDNSVALNDYNITFTDVKRSQSGVYKLTVSNSAGNDSASFTLNVQYAPEGVRVITTVYINLGDNVTLTAFINFSGNPAPITSWFNESDDDIILPGGRFQILTPTQLMITNVISGDIGTYQFNAQNILGNLSTEINLVEALPPGAPTNLSVGTVSISTADLSWDAPSFLGYPPLSDYVVRIQPSVPNMMYTTNTTYIMLAELFPNTIYNVSVVGISTFFQYGGTPSDWITFITSTGPPSIKAVNFTPVNGSIDVMWELQHTGGVSTQHLSVIAYCSTDMDFSLGSGSGSDYGSGRGSQYLLYECSSQCIDSSNYVGSTRLVGTVVAGTKYYCTLIVENEFGRDSQDMSNNIIPITGTPSIPIITVHPGSGVLTIIVRFMNSGVQDGETFQFKVTVTDTVSNIVHNQSYVYTDYLSNSNVTVIIQVPSGQYYVTIIAGNKYGNSEYVTVGPFMAQASPSQTPTASQMPTTAKDDLPLFVTIVPTVVGGLILAVFVIGLIICVSMCCYNRQHKKRNAEIKEKTEQWKPPKRLRVIRKKEGEIMLEKFKNHASSETEVCSDPKSQKPDNSNLSSKPVDIVDTPLLIGIEGTIETSADSTEENNDTSCVVEES